MKIGEGTLEIKNPETGAFENVGKVESISIEFQKFYRYTLNYQGEDQDTHLELDEYDIISETKKGYWIGYGDTKYKWVHKDKSCGKQFAWDTKEKAMDHFIRRTKKRIGWYNYFLHECKTGVKIAEKNLEKGLTDQSCLFNN